HGDGSARLREPRHRRARRRRRDGDRPHLSSRSGLRADRGAPRPARRPHHAHPMTAQTVTLALSKGRILEETLPLLARAGIAPAVRRGARLRVATKYIATAREHFAAKGMHVDLIRLYGSMELAPLTGLADAIVDLVDTGRTLRANRLTAVEEIMRVSSRLIVN